MNNEKQLTRSAGRIAFGTSISRVLGYIRDMLVAHTFGAGFAADAFYAAYRIPNLLRRLLGEGSLSASFIPVLSEYLQIKNKEETQELINVVFTVLLVMLSGLTIIGIIFTPEIVNLIAYGFKSDPQKMDLTISLTRIMFPFLLFICLAALCLGILNSLSSFFIPSIAPASLSISEIVFILSVAPLLSTNNKIIGLAVSVMIGGLGQFVVQLPKLIKLGWHLRLKFKLAHEGLKKVSKLMIPSMIGLSVDQVNAFVDTVCASFLAQGSITALYYSNRVMQMPLAIFGLAMASVALPTMSRAAAENNLEDLKKTLNYAIRLILFILIPAAAGLLVIGLPIIRVLFERGHFSYDASIMTNSALFFYSLGLPAFAIVKVLASAFFSMQETKTPVKVGALAMVVNVVLNILLMKPLGVGGLALATTIASYFNVVLLALILRKQIGIIGIRTIIKSSIKTLIASLVMVITCYFIAFVVFKGSLAIGMFAALAGGLTIFVFMAVLLNIEERKPILEMILKQAPSVDA